MQKDTTRQLDLIAASTEQAVIDFLKLGGKDASKMRGRSRVTFQKKDKVTLEGMEDKDGSGYLITRAKWLRQLAGYHAKLGNKLINIARRMKTSNASGDDTAKKKANQDLIESTIKGYLILAAKQAKRAELSEEQKKQVAKSWTQNKAKNTRRTSENEQEENVKTSEAHVEEVQQAAQEIKEMLQQVMACNTMNPIHSAKLTRIGELHVNKAKNFNAKVKAHVKAAKRESNDCKTKGVKNLSRAIGGQRAKPLTCVCRDRDTKDGGKAGQITTDPQEVDAVVKRAWQLIYNGIS